MMTHPFLSFRDNINSLFDDFHNDFFTDPWANNNMNMNDQQQRRDKCGHDRRRLNYDNSDATRSELQPYSGGGWMNSWDQSTAAALQPASAVKLNVHEEKDKYVVQADVPGVRKEDVRLNIQDGYLTISAERKECHTEGDPQLLKQQQQQQKEKSSMNASAEQQQQRRWVRREVSYGKVERSVALPRDVDQNAISARHEHGVLKITLPKTEQHSNKGTIAIE